MTESSKDYTAVYLKKLITISENTFKTVTAINDIADIKYKFVFVNPYIEAYLYLFFKQGSCYLQCPHLITIRFSTMLKTFLTLNTSLHPS